jgi:hypothetical protein
MNDEDTFAVWIAAAVLRTDGDTVAASTLEHMASQTSVDRPLDTVLGSAAAPRKRPGDFGLEFVAPFLPLVLVEFGRLLWHAYTAALAKKGGEALATATVDRIKALLKRTLSNKEAEISLAEAEERLRQAALAQHLSAEQTNRLIASLRDPRLIAEIDKESVDGSG